MTSKRIISGIVALTMLAGMFPTNIVAGADDTPITLTPSAPTGQLTITLKIKSTPDTPNVPLKSSVTKNSVTLSAVAGCEYSMDGTTWQDSPEFTGLTPSTEYKFYQRFAETETTNASDISPALTVTTEADTYGLTITLVIENHEHAWTYAAGTGDKANTITATCNGTGDCDITEGLTLTINAPTGDLTYDGTANAATLSTGYNTTAFPGTYAIEYYKGSEKLTSAPINAGTYTAKVTAGEATASVTYTIAPKEVTVTADNIKKTYGKSDPDLTYQVPEGSLIGSDKITGTLSRAPGNNVGTYAIAGTLSAGDNYIITVTPGTFTIEKAEITITADNKSSKYGQDIVGLTYAVTGDYVTGDDLGVTLNTTATKTSSVGEYPITVSWNSNSNYTATLNNGKYTITKAPFTVNATGYSGTYDGSAHSISVVTEGSDATVYYGTEALTADNYATAGSTTNPEYTAASSYTVYFYVVSDNYDVTPVSGSKTVSIAKKTLTVTADAKSKTYGEDDPELTFTSSGLIGTDTITGKLARVEGEDVGEYAIHKGTLDAGDNYELTVNGAIFTIDKAQLTVTAKPAGKVYGEKDPELEYEVSGLVEGDTLKGKLSREIGESTGTYKITKGTLRATNNYEMTFKSADFTITQSDAIVTAPTAKDLTYNGLDQKLVTAGKTSGGKLVYALSDSATKAPESGWSTKIPTGKQDGTYYVWYKVEGNNNFTGTEPVCIEVTIKKSKAQKIAEAKAVKTTLTDVWSVEYGTLSAAWTSDAEADGYEVLIWNSRRMGGRTTVSKFDAGNDTEIKIDGLMPGTRYYAKARAYKVIDGEKVYGKYSRTGSATVKGFDWGFGFSSFPGYGHGFAPYTPWSYGYGHGYGYGYGFNPYADPWSGYGYGPGYGRPHISRNNYSPYFFYWF